MMSQQTKPIKRSKELAPLSREHHEGLLLGWKIKQGLRNGTDHKIIARFIQWFWENNLQEHFRKEEEVLASFLPKDNEWVQRMFAEHEAIEALIHVNAMIPDEDIFSQLCDSLHNHIRFEEREFFPFVERMIPAKDMEEIYLKLAEVKEKKVWDDEFWVRK